MLSNRKGSTYLFVSTERSLKAFCIEQSECIFVINFIQNGTKSDNSHKFASRPPSDMLIENFILFQKHEL